MSSMHFSSKTFARAAQIAEKIETLENRLRVLLKGGKLDSGKAEHSKGSAEAQNLIAKKGRHSSS